MYVCICKGVTDKQIQREMRNGACSFEEIQDRLQVSLCCGQCREFAIEVVNSTNNESLALAI